MARLTKKKLLERIVAIKAALEQQHFQIDVTYEIYKRLKAALSHRNDLNIPTIAAYWGKEIRDHYILNDFKLHITNVIFEEDYYSYLNLPEINLANAQLGNETFIVDLITDSTDVKTGEDMDEWFSSNDFFQDIMKDEWMNRNLPLYQQDDLLETKKGKNINYEHYWNYEDYIYLLKIKDTNNLPIVIFLLGTYADYS